MGNTDKDNPDLTTMLAEAQKAFEAQVRSVDILRDHGKTMLGVSSLLVTLFTTFGVTDLPQDHFLATLYTITIVVIAALYIWLIVENLEAILPQKIWRPIEPLEQEYIDAFYKKTQAEVLLQSVSNYLNIIPRNKVIIDQMFRASRRITALFAAIFILIVLLSLLQVYNPGS
jgi:hypothetical protein